MKSNKHLVKDFVDSSDIDNVIDFSQNSYYDTSSDIRNTIDSLDVSDIDDFNSESVEIVNDSFKYKKFISKMNIDEIFNDVNDKPNDFKIRCMYVLSFIFTLGLLVCCMLYSVGVL